MDTTSDVRGQSTGRPTDGHANVAVEGEVERAGRTNSPYVTVQKGVGEQDQRPIHVRIKEIHPLDALTRALLTIRPSWDPAVTRAAVANDPRPPAVAIPAAIHCALNPEIHHPNAIGTYQVRPTTASQQPDTLRCPHGHNAVRLPDGHVEGVACRRCTPPAPMPDVLRAFKAAHPAGRIPDEQEAAS